MASIEEMLAQAESMTVEENWFRLEKYPEKSFYSDSDIGVDVVDRKISNADRNVSTTEEKNSQYISFIMDRYCDGVDLTTMLIQVKYELPDGSGSIDGVVNAYASESQIRFGWVVPSTITQEEGTILLMVFCSGNLSDGNSYLLKTQPLPYTINKTLDIEGTLPEPDENWYVQFINTMNERVTAASRYASEARESATEADETLAAIEDIQADVTQSKKEVQTLATQVQNNTSKAQNAATNAEASASSASKSADDAKKYSEQAFSTTPEGYEVLVGDVDLLKNAIVQTTDRTLYGSKAGGIKLIGIKGASEQKQYSGKNLLDLSSLEESISSGVTFTPIFENGLLQYINVNGVASEQARYYFPSNLVFDYDTILSIDGATNGGVSGYASGGNVFAEEKTITAGTSYATFFLFVNAGITVNNVKIYPMISVEGGDFEPYVGATPSPNPSYPQEIESVGDIKNLLEVTASSQTVNGVEFVVNEDKTITANGTATANTYVSIGTFEAVKDGKYILSGSPSGSAYSTYYLYTQSSDGTWVYEYGSGTEISLSKGDKIDIQIAVKSDVTVSNLTFKPMIRKASVQNAEYKPYGYSLGIKAEGKNLARVNNFSATAQGTALDYTPINMPIGTYAIGLVTSATSGSADILFYNADKVEITKKNINLADFNARKSFLFTVNSDISYVRVWTNTACEFTDFQIEPNKATPYEPYRSKSITIPLNEPLRSIGDVKDKIICQDGVWYINRNVASEVFDGSEDGWVMLATNHGDGNLFYIPLENLGVKDTSMSTQSLLQKNVAVLDMLLNHHRNTSGNFYIVASFSTLDDWKTHLAENPIPIQYGLATPTFEPFTDQTPFYGLESFDTVTYISTDSEVEPTVILKFAKTEGDAVTLLNYNQTNLNRIAIEEFIKSNTSQEVTE